MGIGGAKQPPPSPSPPHTAHSPVSAKAFICGHVERYQAASPADAMMAPPYTMTVFMRPYPSPAAIPAARSLKSFGPDRRACRSASRSPLRMGWEEKKRRNGNEHGEEGR